MRIANCSLLSPKSSDLNKIQVSLAGWWIAQFIRHIRSIRATATPERTSLLFSKLRTIRWKEMEGEA